MMKGIIHISASTSRPLVSLPGRKMILYVWLQNLECSQVEDLPA